MTHITLCMQLRFFSSRNSDGIHISYYQSCFFSITITPRPKLSPCSRIASVKSFNSIWWIAVKDHLSNMFTTGIITQTQVEMPMCAHKDSHKFCIFVPYLWRQSVNRVIRICHYIYYDTFPAVSEENDLSGFSVHRKLYYCITCT